MYLYFCPNGQVIILFVLFISIHFVINDEKLLKSGLHLYYCFPEVINS